VKLRNKELYEPIERKKKQGIEDSWQYINREKSE